MVRTRPRDRRGTQNCPGSAVPASKEQALCGEAVSGWFIFGHTAFTGSDAADCRRCEQLLPRVLPEVDKGVSGRHTVPG